MHWCIIIKLLNVEKYGIDQAGLTTLASVTSVVGLFAGFIFGPILDKLGSRKTILVSLAIVAVLFYVRAFVASYALAVVLTFLASFLVGVCQVAASKVLATWFPPESVSVAYSFQAAGYLLGWFCPVGTVTWVWLILGGLFMGGTVGLTTGRTAVIPLTGEFPPEAIGTAAGGLLVPELGPKGELQQKANANK